MAGFFSILKRVYCHASIKANTRMIEEWDVAGGDKEGK